MSNIFYPKLALQNIKKNGKFYFPYIITCIGTVAMFYIICAITADPGLKKMPGYDSLKYILNLGCIVVGIFAVIFLFYTNSFLMKRRTKEIGLYNILGMEKRHIGKVMFYETSYIGILGMVCGLLLGILFDKLIVLILCKIISFQVPIGFSISYFAIATTTALYGGIIFLTLVSNLARIHLSKPIELLYGVNTGEKEPKTKWVITILGFASLITGYYIAITVKSPLTAITMFFIAVLLVIFGTYCLFTTGSIAILKLLRKNKGYYYNTKNFISVSGMIYRMKQNAVGLANICILSTMVLVMVSTTVCMYIGVEDSLNSRYPKDCVLYMYDVKTSERDTALKVIDDTLKGKVENLSYYTSLSAFTIRDGESFKLADKVSSYTDSNLAMVDFVTEEEYERLSGNNVNISDNEILVYEAYGKLGDSLRLIDKDYKVKEHLKTLDIDGYYSALLVQQYFIVVNSKEMDRIYSILNIENGKGTSQYKASILFNLNVLESEKISLAYKVNDNVKKAILDKGGESIVRLDNRQINERDFYALYGGFLFLGLFLGILFFMATALILYYKQISEGYDDKLRFEIMQKVGMSKEEVKTSIKSQVLKVFFLPIIVAAIHVAGAFNMITKLLALFSLTNINLFLICTLITIVVFATIYAIVYGLTTKVYYNIVK